VTYRVQVYTQGRYWSFPVNLATYRQLCGRADASETEFKDYLARAIIPCEHPANSRDAMLACVGPELYELFFRGYTLKQWGRPAEALDASVCRRIPWRSDVDERYFHDEFQASTSGTVTVRCPIAASACNSRSTHRPTVPTGCSSPRCR